MTNLRRRIARQPLLFLALALITFARFGDAAWQRMSPHGPKNARREFLLLGSASLILPPEIAHATAPPQPSDAVFERRGELPTENQTVQLTSGVTFCDLCIGKGPKITKSAQVLIHIRAWISDGVLFDTAEDKDGRPILHSLSMGAEDYDGFRGDSSTRSKVTMGLEDAIVSRGNASWDYGSGRVDPMREGGIRTVVVPAPMAYGNVGVSRYDAYMMRLRKAVPRDEVLRYVLLKYDIV